MNIGRLLQVIEALAPVRYTLTDDPVGLQIGKPEDSVSKVLVSLDSSLAAIEFAKSIGADTLVSHHPLIYVPVQTISSQDRPGPEIRALIESSIAFIGVHTNWDTAPQGIADTLAELIQLSGIESFGSGTECEALKLTVYVPKESLSQLIDHLSAAGAGRIGKYERCAYITDGTGTFMPMEGSSPTIGVTNKIEEVEESRLEMVFRPERLNQVREALLKNHPYEEPAYDFTRTIGKIEAPLGRIGNLSQPLSPHDLQSHVDEALETRSQVWIADNSAPIERIAVCGGAGSFIWKDALDAGAQAFLTGEIPQHVALEASQRGLCMIQAGHYATEHPGCVKLASLLKESLPEVEIQVYTPEPGQAGRPF